MKSISKQLYLALTGVCVIALVVFLVQLIVINAGGDSGDPDLTVSGGSAQGSENQTGDPGGIVEDSPTPEPPTLRPTPEGTRREIPADEHATLVIYSDDELFEYIENELDWRFEYKASENIALEISFAYSPPQGDRAEVAEAFLNGKLGGNLAEYMGTRHIQDSPLMGTHARAQVGNIIYESWLYHLSGSDLALAFLINYEFNGQRDDLYTVLSSISVEQG